MRQPVSGPIPSGVHGFPTGHRPFSIARRTVHGPLHYADLLFSARDLLGPLSLTKAVTLAQQLGFRDYFAFSRAGGSRRRLHPTIIGLFRFSAPSLEAWSEAQLIST
jgi:hypothetical protein